MIRVFIPIKEKSQRVPGKNFRLFEDDEPLWLRAVRKYQQFASVHVNTDSKEILDVIGQMSKIPNPVIGIKRIKKFLGHKVAVTDILRDFVDRVCSCNDIVVQVHVTSPFLTIETLDKAVSLINKQTDETGQYCAQDFDSCVGCNIIHSRLWRKENYGFCPVNHNPMKLEQTQDLPSLYEENSACYVFNAAVMMIHANRIGVRPTFLEVPFPENLDIDTEENWNFCRLVAENLKRK